MHRDRKSGCTVPGFATSPYALEFKEEEISPK
jgi:hypothetical protein